MYFRDTGFVPQDPNNKGYLRNPNGSMPYPRPNSMPIGLWDGGEVALMLANAAAPDWKQATWSSPVFDLRPDLRSSTGGGTEEGVAIWKYAGSGRGGRLHVVINNIGDGATKSLDVKALEFISPNNSQSVVQVTDCVNVSDQFVVSQGGRNATYISFEPTGEYPIRYWQVKLDFLWGEVLAADPQFTIFSSFY